MKKVILPLLLITIFIGTVVFANVKGPTKEKHLGLKGLDGAKVNCVYCHKKAGNPKTEGNDVKKLKEGKYCAIKACHPEVDKKKKKK
jgi:hypothetical protein